MYVAWFDQITKALNYLRNTIIYSICVYIKYLLLPLHVF